MSVYNAGKPFGAPDPAEGAYSAPPEGPDLLVAPSPRSPPELSALRASYLGLSGLTPYLPKSIYQNGSELNLF